MKDARDPRSELTMDHEQQAPKQSTARPDAEGPNWRAAREMLDECGFVSSALESRIAALIARGEMMREALRDLVEDIECDPANRQRYYGFERYADHLPSCPKPRGDQGCQCGYAAVRVNLRMLLEACEGYEGRAPIDKARAALAPIAAEPAQPSRAERMRDAGYTRRPSLRELTSDGEPAPVAQPVLDVTEEAARWRKFFRAYETSLSIMKNGNGMPASTRAEIEAWVDAMPDPSQPVAREEGNVASHVWVVSFRRLPSGAAAAG